MASPFIVTIAEKINVQAMLVGGVVCLAGGVGMLLAKETLVVEGGRKEGEEEEGTRQGGQGGVGGE